MLTKSTPTSKSVKELVRKRKVVEKELEEFRLHYESVRGFNARYPTQVLKKKMQSYDIRLAKLGYSPDGVPVRKGRK
jgi:hypothetical protein